MRDTLKEAAKEVVGINTFNRITIEWDTGEIYEMDERTEWKN